MPSTTSGPANPPVAHDSIIQQNDDAASGVAHAVNTQPIAATGMTTARGGESGPAVMRLRGGCILPFPPLRNLNLNVFRMGAFASPVACPAVTAIIGIRQRQALVNSTLSMSCRASILCRQILRPGPQ
ncbi:hypothetical protein DFH11DRAFT_1544764 [Phellopilus nigrolimitatus]|nr:hypothetical protein DFH11DRAFT_1544764 [Phellopilus nigrolimitatus]